MPQALQRLVQTEGAELARRTGQVELSILIVNWNAVKYLRTCLTTIYEQVRGIEFEVILVDNASYDGSAELIRDEFLLVNFVQSEKNLGFARGNNLAFRHSKGEFIFLLNPDTELTDDAVITMIDYLKSDPSVGAVGCCLLNSDRTLQWKYLQAFPTVWNQMLTCDVLQRMFPRWSVWGIRPLFDYNGRPLDVDVLAGSCVMLKRSVFEQVGLLSEEYYMYGDDVDLCYKIWEAGYAVRYIGSKRIVHHGGTSAAFRQENHFSAVMQKESRLKFFLKTRGRAYASLYRSAMGVTALVRLVLILCMVPFATFWINRKGLAGAACKWWSVLRWAAGRENWVARRGQ